MKKRYQVQLTKSDVVGKKSDNALGLLLGDLISDDIIKVGDGFSEFIEAVNVHDCKVTLILEEK
ncbi:MAG: hypothetical protein PHN88_16270 [Ignavibacteria bacterium]|nr:hypothetical protein [Ignavibacteria bacterium]